MALPLFQADFANVIKLHPDFITLNEVAYRTDAMITPAGYASYRSMSSVDTRETPVLWRTDRWTKISTGNRYLTTKNVKWGVRAVNWVTVRDKTTGQVVSVISAHPAPDTAVTHELLPIFMTGLASLVTELSKTGPVFAGGDFNVVYLSKARWPASRLATAHLAATYDTLGRLPGGTGDYRGATIDYLFYQAPAGVTATQQGKFEMNSDHDSVWADFTIAPPVTARSSTGQRYLSRQRRTPSRAATAVQRRPTMSARRGRCGIGTGFGPTAGLSSGGVWSPGFLKAPRLRSSWRPTPEARPASRACRAKP